MQNGGLIFKTGANITHNPEITSSCNIKGSIFQLSQMPCKWEALSPQFQVDIAECRQCCKHLANVCCAFLCFWPWKSLRFFFSPFLVLQNLTELLTSRLWYCLCLPFHCNQHQKFEDITSTAYTCLHPNKDHTISCWCVPSATPTATRTATKTTNVGVAINHQFLMVYTTHLWWLGGWFIIAN